jgi:hypothetical protein
MGRTVGAKNIAAFSDRTTISTTSSGEIKHLSKTGTVLENFQELIKHQRNYATWLKTRHRDLKKAKETSKRESGDKTRGPKNATYEKYTWYSESICLLEAINSFETFYKRSLIALAKALKEHVSADSVKGSVDAKVLWAATVDADPIDLIFESRLYHDLDAVDEATQTLIAAKRYNKNSQNNPLRDQIRGLQAIFQIRHTLSHNHGRVTESDATKLRLLGFQITVDEVIDPSKNQLGDVVRDLLEDEAAQFTDWLLKQAAKYLKKRAQDTGSVLRQDTKAKIEASLGVNSNLTALSWS